jgi:hypothetical protein
MHHGNLWGKLRQEALPVYNKYENGLLSHFEKAISQTPAHAYRTNPSVSARRCFKYLIIL